jgi:primosomal protein N' (replication factor Y) (superfamily II helicase)
MVSTIRRSCTLHRCAQLWAQAGERKALHDFLSAWLTQLENEKLGRQVRWSLDVDPVEMY